MSRAGSKPANYLRAWREIHGFTQGELAQLIRESGYQSASTKSISNLEIGARILTQYWLERIARVYYIEPALLLRHPDEISDEELLAQHQRHGKNMDDALRMQTTHGIKRQRRIVSLSEHTGAQLAAMGKSSKMNYTYPADLAVYHSVAAGDGIDILTDWVDYIKRPPKLIGMNDAFGVRVSGTSMEPLLYDGDIVYVSPSARPRLGSLCVIEQNNNTGLIKEFRGATSDEWIFRQYNPPAGQSNELKIAKTLVKSVMPVIQIDKD